MKKTIIISLIVALAIGGCKKKEGNVSQLVTASTPTVTLTGPSIYDIAVGGTLPTISATAYDSFYQESIPVKIDQSTLDNTTPGLYTVNVTATNQYGYVGSAPVLVAVQNRPAAEDISGQYLRAATGFISNVTKIGTGLYLTDNAGGTAALPVAAYFVITSDSTIDFGTQPTSDGTLSAEDATISFAPGDTTLAYALNASGFATSVRTFVKQ